MAKDLDAQVEAFRTRPLDAGPYTFVAADALTMKLRENGRVVNAAVLVATGVNGDCHVATGETAAAWLAFFADLLARGLSGVRLVTSDAHAGSVAATGATLRGATWRWTDALRGEPDAGVPEVVPAGGQGDAVRRDRPRYSYDMTSSHLREPFCCFTTGMEAAPFWGRHRRAFAHLGGVPGSMVYNRMKTVIRSTSPRAWRCR